MLAHDLANLLLSGPNIRVKIQTANGVDTFDNGVIFTEDSTHTYHYYGESGAPNIFPEIATYLQQVDQAEQNNQPLPPPYSGRKYDLFDEPNADPTVIIVSDNA